MSERLLIYGATGFTGRLVVQEALARGVDPILCGRDAAKLALFAEETGLEHRVAELSDADALDQALSDVAVMLHAADAWREQCFL